MELHSHRIIAKVEEAIMRGDVTLDAAEAVFDAIEIDWERRRHVTVQIVIQKTVEIEFGTHERDIALEALAALSGDLIPEDLESFEIIGEEGAV